MSTPWAQVYTTSTVYHASIVEGYLESQGIPARVVSAADSSRALTVGSLAVVKIYVPADRAVTAEGLLRNMEKNSSGELSDGEEDRTEGA